MTLSVQMLILFRVDSQVRGLRQRLESAQIYLNAQQRQLDELQQQHTELESMRKQVKATVANLEVETKSIDERIEKLREELNAAQTNRQYTAVLTEMNTVKLQRNELEDRELAEMERIDELTRELAENDTKIADRIKVRDHAEQQLKQRGDDIGDKLAELEAERATAAGNVPDDALRIFDGLADDYDGEAMAPIEEISKRHREYACGACNMHAPFESVSILIGGGNTVVTCSACGRMLYMQDELKGALVKR